MACCTVRGEVGLSLKVLTNWTTQKFFVAVTDKSQSMGDEAGKELQNQEWGVRRRNSTLNTSYEKRGSEGEQRENILRNIWGVEGSLTSFVLFEKC